jgi:cell division protein FtsW (lipid II flippase)
MRLKNKNHYLEQVKSQINSKEAKNFIAEELDHHIKETEKKFIENGVSEDAAEQKAIEHMGSPIQLGIQFNKLHRPRVDWLMVLLLLSVLSIGFLPIVSSYKYIGTDYYLKKKMLFVSLGIAATLAMMFFDYRKMKNAEWLFYTLGIFFLLIINFFPNAYVNGVPNIRIGPLTIENLMAIPFFFIAWGSFLNSSWLKPIHFMFLFSIPILLLFNIPSISTAYIYIVMVFSMLWWSKMKRKSIIKIFTRSALILSTLIIWFHQTEWINKLLAFLHPEKDPNGGGYLILQIKELMSNATWFGNPAVKDIVPSGQTDLVFVFFTYHYGWFFAIILGILLSLFIARIVIVIPHIKDTFGKILLIGAIALYSVQMISNIAMTLGLFPLIEMSLPFISYGLMPVIFNSFLMGIVLSVYRRKDLTSSSIAG